MRRVRRVRLVAALAGLALAARAEAERRRRRTGPSPRARPAAGATRRSPTSRPRTSRRCASPWTYHHGDFWAARLPPTVERSSAFESTPIVVDGRLFFTTPRNRVIALDPETGRELWTFDPELERGGIYANMWINRGVAYWRGPAAPTAPAPRACSSPRSTRACSRSTRRRASRAPTSAASGTREPARRARARLRRARVQRHLAGHRGRRRDRGGLLDRRHAAPRLRRPATCARSTCARARCAGRSTRFRTRASPATRPGRPAPRSRAPRTCGRRSPPTSRAAGCSCPCHAEPRLLRRRPPRREPVQRLGRGARRRDRAAHLALPDRAPRSLGLRPRRATRARDTRARRAGRVDAVVQATKHGFVFVLDRETGEPLFPVEERPVPASDVPGERAWPTQPVPTAPPPLVPQRLTEADLYAPTPAAPRRVPRAARRAAQRGLVHAAEPARLGALSVHGRRRELVGRELRPRAPAPRRAGAEPRAPRATRGGRRAHDRRRQRCAAAQRHEPARTLVAVHGHAARAIATAWLRSAAASCSSTTACRATGRRGAGSSPWISRAARSRGARRRARATAIRAAAATGPRSSPRAASCSTAARGARAARARRPHRRADRHLRPARGPARGPDQLQARARRQAVPRRRAGRSRRRRLADRRRGDRLHAAVTSDAQAVSLWPSDRGQESVRRRPEAIPRPDGRVMPTMPPRQRGARSREGGSEGRAHLEVGSSRLAAEASSVRRRSGGCGERAGRPIGCAAGDLTRPRVPLGRSRPRWGGRKGR